MRRAVGWPGEIDRAIGGCNASREDRDIGPCVRQQQVRGIPWNWEPVIGCAAIYPDVRIDAECEYNDCRCGVLSGVLAGNCLVRIDRPWRIVHDLGGPFEVGS